jgi:hypothetical protein
LTSVQVSFEQAVNRLAAEQAVPHTLTVTSAYTRQS